MAAMRGLALYRGSRIAPNGRPLACKFHDFSGCVPMFQSFSA